MWLKSFLPLDEDEDAEDFGLSLALFASDLPALALAFAFASAARSPPLILLRPRLDLSLLSLLLRLGNYLNLLATESLGIALGMALGRRSPWPLLAQHLICQ